jgi:hypothetical protein
VRMPVWLGASCIVALLGTGLFSQNVITRPFVNIIDSPGGVVYISRTLDSYTYGLSGDIFDDQGPDSQMASYGLLGFAYSSNIIAGTSAYPYDDLSLNGLFQCDSANCTFELYDTLSICTQCVDISEEIRIDSDRFVLRSGVLSIDIEKGVLNITSDTDYPDWDRLKMDAPGPLLVHYLALVHDLDYSDANPAAVECVAYWCVAAYQSSVRNGLLYEVPGNADHLKTKTQYNTNGNTITNTSDSAHTFYGQEQDVVIRLETCRFNRTMYEDSESCTFRVTAMAQLALQNFLSKGYMGNLPLLSGSKEFVGAPNVWRTTSFAASALDSVCWPAPDERCQHRLVESISTSFTNMTAFMTNVIRKTTDDADFSYGTLYASTQVYHIRYDREFLHIHIIAANPN